MMNGEEKMRVWNRCKYDIGIKLLNGSSLNIKSGSFTILSVNDIIYVETLCDSSKFFAQKMLEIVDNDGKAVSIDEVGLYSEADSVVHLTDDEIIATLKQPVKKIEAWIANIDDPAELDSIFKAAKTVDLPTSKMKVLSAKMPSKSWIDAEE